MAAEHVLPSDMGYSTGAAAAGRTEWKDRLQDAIRRAISAAAVVVPCDDPGYMMVAEFGQPSSNPDLFRPYHPPIFAVFSAEDSVRLQNSLQFDWIAQCFGHRVYGIGRARHYIAEDGTVS